MPGTGNKFCDNICLERVNINWPSGIWAGIGDFPAPWPGNQWSSGDKVCPPAPYCPMAQPARRSCAVWMLLIPKCCCLLFQMKKMQLSNTVGTAPHMASTCPPHHTNTSTFYSTPLSSCFWKQEKEERQARRKTFRKCSWRSLATALPPQPAGRAAPQCAWPPPRRPAPCGMDGCRRQLLSSVLIHVQQMVSMTPLLFSGWIHITLPRY